MLILGQVPEPLESDMRTLRTLIVPMLLLVSLPALAADTYVIDATHSEISFKIRHMLAKTTGRFTKFEGAVVIDEKDLKKSTVEVTIDVASINTDSDGRDKHLRGADFFDVAQFPKITFKSTAVREVEKGKLEITGAFTMRGVTKTITFPITNAGTQPGMRPGSVVAGFIDGALKLNRNEFGIKYGAGMLGDEVEISLNVEAGKAAPKP
jgi:polyisoprenoid-binding protein YceI